MPSGLLTGAFTAERARALGADDWRSGSADFTTGLSANLALVDALRPIAARHGVGVAEMALARATAADPPRPNRPDSNHSGRQSQ